MHKKVNINAILKLDNDTTLTKSIALFQDFLIKIGKMKS